MLIFIILVFCFAGVVDLGSWSRNLQEEFCKGCEISQGAKLAALHSCILAPSSSRGSLNLAILIMSPQISEP